MKDNYFITTPIYYVNDVPHIGHAYTTIAADVIARYNRLLGKNVFFLTGTDEHGAKIAEAAQKKNINPQDLVDELSLRFNDCWKVLNINYNQFIRTTDPSHKDVVSGIVERLITGGYVEKRKYEGLYCISCERFYSGEELVNNLCPDHKRECVTHSEENYFFNLSEVADKFDLLGKIESDQIEVRPIARKKEVLGKIKKGLEDVSISRQAVEWGIGFPGDHSQTIYVWIDALINYYSATKIFKDRPSWPADIHLMAKDILWFHAIIWPAILLAVGEDTPKKVFAHGFFTIDGQKMSKTIGNVLDPVALAQKYGTDSLRYALLREFPFGEDGDISEEKILSRYNDLASGLGNLTSRILTMIEKYSEGVVPNCGEDFDHSRLEGLDRPGEKVELFWTNYQNHIENLEFDRALKEFELFVNYGNSYIENSKPWVIAKEGDAETLNAVLFNLAESLRHLSIMIYPFMPEVSDKIRLSLGIKVIDDNNFSLDDEKKWGLLKSGTKINKGDHLFPRLDS